MVAPSLSVVSAMVCPRYTAVPLSREARGAFTALSSAGSTTLTMVVASSPASGMAYLMAVAPGSCALMVKVACPSASSVSSVASVAAMRSEAEPSVIVLPAAASAGCAATLTVSCAL